MRKLIIYIVIIVLFAVWFFSPSPKEHIKIYFHRQGEISEMEFEQYLSGVLAAEMPASFELEALKAQAVAARTYTLRKIQSGRDGRHKGADICTDSAHCQAYRDLSELSSPLRQRIRKAVSDTKGEVIIYGGELIDAVFHSAAHGYTERSADVWGGDVPYLQSVESPWDTECPDYIKEEKFSVEEIRKIFDLPSGVPIIGEITRSGAGGVMEIKLAGKMVKGADIRQKLGLRSTCFTADEAGGVLTFRTEGYGHGVGLSQWGAQGMAKAGQTYDEILKHYYKDIEIK